MPNTELFYDPLGVDFIQEVQQPIRDKSIEEKLSLVSEHVPRRRRTSRVKFYLSLDLKKRLQTLINKSEEGTPIIKIAEQLLRTKYVDADSINYLDLSNDDYTKISFLNKDRYDRIKDDVFKTYYITSKTRILAKYRTIVIGTYKDEFGSLAFGEHPLEVFLTFCLTKNMVPTNLRMKSKKVFKDTVTKEDGGVEYVYDYTYEAPDNFEIARLYTFDGNFNHRYFCFREGQLKHLHNLELKDLDFKFDRLKEVVKSSVWNPEQRFHTSIHKVLNKLFPIEFTEREKNIFAEAYYKLVVITDKNYAFSIVKGEAIREAYLDANYLQPSNGGTLWNSCMRYNYCQDYLDIYVDNPAIVSMAVLRKNNMVVARALIWTDDNGGKHIDRIYTYDAKAESLITASLDSLSYPYLRAFHGDQKYQLEISLDYTEMINYRKYPYMDSLRYYNTDNSTLQNHNIGFQDFLEFNQTDGTYYSIDNESHECEFCGSSSTNNDFLSEVTLGRGSGSYGCDECVTYSEVLDRNLRSDCASYCDYSTSYVPEDDMLVLSDGSYCYNEHEDLEEYENEFGHFLRNHDEFEYRELDGCYYHPDDSNYDLLILKNQQIEENETNNDNQESINTESSYDVLL